MSKDSWKHENTVVCIDVESRSRFPSHEQLGHNTAINALKINQELQAVSPTARSFPYNISMPIRKISQKYTTSFQLTTAQYFRTTIRKHHKCVEMAIKNKDMLSNYQHAINDLHLALSLGSKSLDTVSINQDVMNGDLQSASIMCDNLNRVEYENALLMTGHLHFIYGKYLNDDEKYEEALRQFDVSKNFIDQYAQMKDLITNSSVTPGILITLMGVLKVYESTRRNNEYIELITKCINNLEKEDIRISDVMLEENSILTSRIYLPHLCDLLYARANLLSKQYGQAITQAYYDLKRALQYCPNHLVSINLLRQLETISSNKQEEAIGLMLKNRFIDALDSISIAIHAQPEDIGLYFDKGAILRKLDRLSESMNCILQGIHLFNTLNNTDDKESSDIYQFGRSQLFLTMNSYAIKLFTEEKYNESNELARQLLEVDPTNYRLLILSGDCQFFMHNYEKSLEEYENAKSIISKLFTGVNHCICNNLMKLPESIQSVNQRICLTCYHLSKNQINQSNWLNALNYLDYCIQLAPFQSNFYMTRALVHYQLNNEKHSWNDILSFIYLNLSDWALYQRTNGKWPIYPIWYQSIIHNQCISHINEQIGPLIHRLTPKYVDLIKIAQSKECELTLLKNIQSTIAKHKCTTCYQKIDDSTLTKTTLLNNNDNQQKFENPIDWLHNHISFDLFSKPSKNTSSFGKMKCKTFDCTTQKKLNPVDKVTYKQINTKIKSIRQNKFL
ncbi:Tetratricopeptide repeat protein 16 [Schistosoma japonicum]|nr:Tetratricopeptide repeat protein 16 [Schistosoma japonicum]